MVTDKCPNGLKGLNRLNPNGPKGLNRLSPKCPIGLYRLIPNSSLLINPCAKYTILFACLQQSRLIVEHNLLHHRIFAFGVVFEF